MWIFVWVSVNAAGVLSSGSIPFPSREACETGGRVWGELAITTTERQRSIPSLDLRCIEAATGKAAPPPTPKP